MAIKIIKEPDIHITEAEYEKYQKMWRASQSMTVSPQSFEVWLRNKLKLNDTFEGYPEI